MLNEMFAQPELDAARELFAALSSRKLTMCTAESCTGGLIAALMTEIPGSSAVFERGFVTYSNGAKCDLLGVPATLIGRYGAVSAEVAVAMASGALRASTADVSVSVTGVAGPGGGTDAKPVGLVHLAAQMRGSQPIESMLTLGDMGRSAIRIETVRAALTLVRQALDAAPGTRATGGP
jgi:nicotinamide-nucleotide amidase